MVFLIEYDRQAGQMVNITRFEDSDRVKAEEKRLKLELELNQKNIHHEVVLLEAENEKQLQHTHRRYYKSLNAILKSTGTT